MSVIPFIILRLMLSPGGFPADTGAAITTHPPARYCVVSLGTLGGDMSDANAINQKGQVAGSAHIAYAHPHFIWQDRYNHAFVWGNAKMTDLGPAPQDVKPVVIVTGINIHGDVIGTESSEGKGGPILWSGGKVVRLAVPPNSSQCRALAINDAGQIVGVAWSRARPIAIRWENGTPRPIGNAGEQGLTATGVNNRGQIVGEAVVGSLDLHDMWHGNYSIRHAVVWDGGKRTDLGEIGGGTGGYSGATAINDNGQIVGYSTVPGKDYRFPHAFLWDQGKMTDLGALPACASSKPLAINNHGQIVGMSDMGAPRHAFLYENGRMTDLNTLIPPDSGWDLISANGINDAGEICGIGQWREHEPTAFLLVPPAP